METVRSIPENMALWIFQLQSWIKYFYLTVKNELHLRNLVEKYKKVNDKFGSV